MTSATAAAPTLWFKAAVFALLACNTAAYIHSGTPSEALDSIAWLVLLILFELETGFGDRLRGGGAAIALRIVRLGAAAAICAAAAAYVREEEWLDAINSGLWIAIVAVMEFQVRSGQRAGARYRIWITAAMAAIYSGLGTMVLVWVWRGEWVDAYDALLWLTALLVIEMNIVRGARHTH